MGIVIFTIIFLNMSSFPLTFLLDLTYTLPQDDCTVNVLNLHRIDLARKYHTHLQREIEKERAREKEWKNSH
jgi:hypothetical protein